MAEGRPLHGQDQVAEIARVLGRSIVQQGVFVQDQLAENRILHSAFEEGVVQHRQPRLQNANSHPLLAVGIGLQKGRLIEVFAFHLGLQHELADLAGVIRLIDQTHKLRAFIENGRIAAFECLTALAKETVFEFVDHVQLFERFVIELHVAVIDPGVSGRQDVLDKG